MEQIILFGVGILAVFYVIRLLWKEVQGKTTCSCCKGCSSTKFGSCKKG
ncbi:hypothetical protein Ga0466249_001717 [Sporomusaceae bacterium BoRhaA]|nr:FeoB-associated Cys-rich membrane protein [Pelorhabdus rhamnosifermentans]MBU2700625.1 hypothetical protein [Pelorhabdus rhamnosifermentans]